jgi:hypothetical protein
MTPPPSSASLATTTRARYDFDSDYLIEMEPYVRHYDRYTAGFACETRDIRKPHYVVAVVPDLHYEARTKSRHEFFSCTGLSKSIDNSPEKRCAPKPLDHRRDLP